MSFLGSCTVVSCVICLCEQPLLHSVTVSPTCVTVVLLLCDSCSIVVCQLPHCYTAHYPLAVRPFSIGQLTIFIGCQPFLQGQAPKRETAFGQRGSHQEGCVPFAAVEKKQSVCFVLRSISATFASKTTQHAKQTKWFLVVSVPL